MARNTSKEDGGMEEKLWEAVKRHARSAYERDKLYIDERTGIPPTYHLGFHCGKCGGVWWTDITRTGPSSPEEMADIASEVWRDQRERGCPACCSKAMEFFGYVFCSTSLVVDTGGSPWRGKMPPAEEIHKLPRFRAYTVYGLAGSRAFAGEARIEREAGVMTVRELELREADPDEFGGPGMLPLSKVRLGAETPMYR